MNFGVISRGYHVYPVLHALIVVGVVHWYYTLMFEEFSAGYYVGRLDIKSYDGSHAVLNRDQHAAANEQICTTGTGLKRLDNPLVMKVENTHVPVFAADDVPQDTLGLPNSILTATQIDNPSTEKAVLMAKAERAADLLDWVTSYTITNPDIA